MPSGVTKKTKSALKLLVVALVGGLLAVVAANIAQKDVASLQIRDQKLAIEIADTETLREQGLCCRDSLPDNHGMLFVYKQPGDYRFWMKATRIPLDMFWISSDKKVVHIEKSVQPNSYPKTYGTDKPAQYILETNAGFAKQHSVKIGDEVSF